MFGFGFLTVFKVDACLLVLKQAVTVEWWEKGKIKQLLSRENITVRHPTGPPTWAMKRFHHEQPTAPCHSALLLWRKKWMRTRTIPAQSTAELLLGWRTGLSGKGDESHVWIYWGQHRQSRDELYAKPSLPFLVSSFPCCINNYLHSWSRGGNGFIKGMQIQFVWASQSKGKAFVLTWVSTEPLLFIYFNEKWAAQMFVRARGFQPFLGTPLEKGLMQSSRTAVCNYAHYRDQASPTLLQSNSGNNRINSYF